MSKQDVTNLIVQFLRERNVRDLVVRDGAIIVSEKYAGALWLAYGVCRTTNKLANTECYIDFDFNDEDHCTYIYIR